MAILDAKYRPAFFTNVIAIATSCAVDVGKNLGYVWPSVENTVHIACFLILLYTLSRVIHTHDATRPFRHVFWGSMSVGLAVLLVSILETPVSHPLSVLRRVLSVTWYSSPFLLLLFYVQSFDRMRANLIEQVNASTRDLTNANHQLQREICDKMLLSNELEVAKSDLEMALEKKSQELEDVEQQILRHERLTALGDIAAGVSHELNNKLTPIFSYSSMLLDNSILTDEQYDWVERITRASESALLIVNNLQQFHSQSAGSPFASISPGAVVNRAVEAIQPVWLTLRDSPQRTLNIETKLQSTKLVFGDANQLQHLLANLIMNAIDSMHPGQNGSITITTRDDTGAVVFEVQDDGQGMAHDEVSRCFEPFFTTKLQNSGLGLSACYGIAKRHGGSIDVESKVGEGTTFTFRVPCVNEEDPAVADAVVSSPPMPRAITGKKKFAGVRILLVEDDQTVRVAMTDLLVSLGGDVESVNNGPAAIDRLQTNDDFDLLLTDLLMSEMDGVELLTACREFSDVPIILMSGWPRRRINERLEGNVKPDAILNKPCKFGDIVKTLEEHAFTRRRHSAPR